MSQDTFIRNGVWAIISKIRDLITGSFIFKSLRFRLFLVLVLISVLPAFIIRGIMLENYKKNAISSKNTEVAYQCQILSDHLIKIGYFKNQDQAKIKDELGQVALLIGGRVLVLDEQCRVLVDTDEELESKTVVSRSVLKCYDGGEYNEYDSKQRRIQRFVPVIEEGKAEVSGIILMTASTAYINSSIAILGRNSFILFTIVSIILFGLAVVVSRLLVKPFERVTAAITGVQDGYETESIQVSGYTEMETIVGAINQLLSRLQILDTSRQEFVSNVSHELKTPLASMKVLADSIVMMGDQAPVEMYREFMEDITHEIDRENSIITDLLSLVKLDKRSGELNIKTVNINEMLELILKRLGPIAQENDIELIYESERNVEAEIDEVKLTLAFSNLVENAIKYNRKNGWVKVELDADHQFFMVMVKDSGIGIPQESLNHVFERFYRVDKSHSREIGGTGLGLAITRSSILMHRGAIKVSSELGQGTEFMVRIPLNYIQ